MTLEKYLDENSSIPRVMGELIKNLLEIESTVKSYADTGGIDKLYDQKFDEFVRSYPELVKWCEDYVRE